MASTPTPPPPTDTVGEQVRAQFETARQLVREGIEQLVHVYGAELHELAASLTGLGAVVDAARAAVVLEAHSRGVIAESDNPRPADWVRQAAVDAQVPFNKPQAAQLQAVTAVCAEHDLCDLRAAVVEGRLPLNTAAQVAKTFRRWRDKISFTNWDALLEILIDWAASGASPRELAQLEEGVIGRFGKDGILDEEHERDYTRRMMTAFRKDRTGMLAATIRLDPASEAQFTSALNALAAPSVDENGVPDGRTAGQRRADALVTMATMATMAANTDPDLPATGVKARITVTVPLADLQAGLDEHGQVDGVGSGCGFSGFGHALTPSEVRMLACDAGIIPAVMGSESEILDLGRETRRITPGQRAALHLRDKGCTFPGCTAPPAWCDGHHIRYWRFDGRTDMKNLSLLCRHHHTEVHRRNHTATVDDHGGVHWTRSDGTPIGNTPRWNSHAEHDEHDEHPEHDEPQREHQHRREPLLTT